MHKTTHKVNRSVNGCARCRKQRVRCDEACPACSACVAAGEPCLGYTKPLRWSQKHEILSRPRRAGNPPARTKPAHSQEDHEGVPASAASNKRAESMQHDFAHEADSSMPRDLSVADANSASTVEFSPSLSEWMQFCTPSLDDEVFPARYGTEQGSQGTDLDRTYALPSSVPWSDAFGLAEPSLLYQHEQPESRTSITSGEISSQAQRSSRKSCNRKVAKPAPGSTGSLLHTFYRLSHPKSVPGHTEDDFVNYYFKHVSRLFSCFDASTNPFHTMVLDCWTTNLTVNLAIQSMAIAHLSNSYPYMATLGMHKRSRACKSLQYDLKHIDRSGSRSGDNEMLSLLLLGLSSSWHVSSNLGSQFLAITRNLIQYRLQDGSAEVSAHQPFFEEALIYWEMLMSFVDPVPMTTFPGHGMPELLPTPLLIPSQPHPWTGVSSELHFAFAEVGRVLRRQRSTSAALYVSDPFELQWAQKLIGYLTALQLPTANQIIDYDDSCTPKQDLIQNANAYRNVSLMELYGVFPSLLHERLIQGNESEGLTSPVIIDPGLTLDQKHIEWSLFVALQTVDCLQQTSIASAACRQQPILLVSVAGQLRLPKDDNTTANHSQDGCTDDETDGNDNKVEHSRWIIESRMLALSKRYPKKPLLRMIEIVKEVWNRLDSGEETHWMDVVNENSWYTIMG